MPEKTCGWQRASLALLLLASGLGSGLPEASGVRAALTAAVAAAAVFPLGPWAARFAPVVRRVGDTLVAGVVALDLLWVVYPVLTESNLARSARPLVLGLTLVGLLTIAGSSHSRPERTLLPVSLGLLITGGLIGPAERAFRAYVATAAVATACWLLAERSSFERRSRSRRLVPLAAFLAGCALFGAGIARFLPWLQPQVEAAAAGLFDPRETTGYTGLSLTSRLGDIEELAQSRRVALRVFTDTPQRLRARVFTRFDGRAWSSQPASGAADLVPLALRSLPPPLQPFFAEIPGDVLAAPAAMGRAFDRGGLIRTRIVQAVDLGALVAPVQPLLLCLPATGRIDLHGVVTPSPSRYVEIYGIVNPLDIGDRPPAPANADFGPELSLPPRVDPRVAALAEQLGGTAGGPVERIRRTLRYLDRNCRYSLEAAQPASPDAVATFLFESRRGYCEYFATSAALLLRLQGVPTRYVTGFNVRDEAYVGSHYAVRESDAHAWIESYVLGQGWSELDPTPSAQYEQVHGGKRVGWLTGLLEGLLATFSELAARLRADSPLAVLRWVLRGLGPLALLAALPLAAVPFVRRLRLRRRRLSDRHAGPALQDPRIAELLRRVDRLLRFRGHARPAARAPGEHLEGLPASAIDPALRADARHAIDCFYRACYGGLYPESEEIDSLLARLPPA